MTAMSVLRAGLPATGAAHRIVLLTVRELSIRRKLFVNRLQIVGSP